MHHWYEKLTGRIRMHIPEIEWQCRQLIVSASAPLQLIIDWLGGLSHMPRIRTIRSAFICWRWWTTEKEKKIKRIIRIFHSIKRSYASSKCVKWQIGPIHIPVWQWGRPPHQTITPMPGDLHSSAIRHYHSKNGTRMIPNTRMKFTNSTVQLAKVYFVISADKSPKKKLFCKSS